MGNVMRKMVRKFIERHATRKAAKEVTRLAAELATAETTIRIQTHEIAELSAVIARNRQRVMAETAIESRRIANAEQGQDQGQDEG